MIQILAKKLFMIKTVKMPMIIIQKRFKLSGIKQMAGKMNLMVCLIAILTL